jgi:hypothetical protein
MEGSMRSYRRAQSVEIRGCQTATAIAPEQAIDRPIVSRCRPTDRMPAVPMPR